MTWTIEEIKEQLRVAEEKMRVAFKTLAECDKAANLANKELQKAILAYGELDYVHGNIKCRLQQAEASVKAQGIREIEHVL